MMIRTALAGAARDLAEAGVEDARREAGWLLAYAAGTSVGMLRAQGDRELPPDVLAAFQVLVARRAAREPIQYILGTQEFCGLVFRVTPDVLIPRLDTEVLVQQAAALLQARAGGAAGAEAGNITVADIGTGSGAIAVAMAHLLPTASVVAVDISEAALAVARENAVANGVADRVDFRRGDLLEPLGRQQVDAILSNPPYIPEEEWQTLMPEVRRWEPRLALTPGEDGLLFYRRLAEQGPARLKPGGFLAVEVGIGQAQAVAALFAAAGLAVSIFPDTAQIDRVVLGRK